jgi:hypothetical protein
LPVLVGGFNIGDTNQNGLLDVDPDGPAGPLGEVFQFTSAGVLIPPVGAGITPTSARRRARRRRSGCR